MVALGRGLILMSEVTLYSRSDLSLGRPRRVPRRGVPTPVLRSKRRSSPSPGPRPSDGTEPLSYLRLIYFVSLNSRLESKSFNSRLERPGPRPLDGTEPPLSDTLSGYEARVEVMRPET